MTVIERLLDKTEPNESGCWIWTGATSVNGYGRIGIGRMVYPTHRVAYEVFVGPIPDGFHIDHLCNVRLCVNPDHLDPVTQGENNRRMGLRNNQCRRGHDWTDPHNVYIGQTGQRRCAVCHRLWQRRAR